MLLVIDNYDSFVHNLARYFQRLGQATHVVRNDRISIREIERYKPAGIVFSPGPGTPDGAGVSLSVVERFAERIPMLGVCLGHQTIAQAFGGQVVRGVEPMHGRYSWISHHGDRIFATLPSPLRVGRYHSLVVQGLDNSFDITATTPDLGHESRLASIERNVSVMRKSDEAQHAVEVKTSYTAPPGAAPGDSECSTNATVMAFAHRTLPIFGLQFHPESVLTQGGYTMLANFLIQAGMEVASIPETEWDDAAFPSQPTDLETAMPKDKPWPTDPISF